MKQTAAELLAGPRDDVIARLQKAIAEDKSYDDRWRLFLTGLLLGVMFSAPDPAP
jgi:hypothetical protein